MQEDGVVEVFVCTEKVAQWSSDQRTNKATGMKEAEEVFSLVGSWEPYLLEKNPST